MKSTYELKESPEGSYWERQFRAKVTVLRSAYHSKCSPFSRFLQTKAKTGFTPIQFQIYRDNFFFRTHTTIPSIARLLMAAAEHEDFATVASLGRNLRDETGNGSSDFVHSNLLLQSHNLHSARVFQLGAIKLVDAENSPYLTQEAISFREEQRKLYSAKEYSSQLAVGFAQESAADEMLRGFYESLFVPYQNWYSKAEFASMSEYFLCHINGTEETHAVDAERATCRSIDSESKLESAIDAIRQFWDAQVALWNSIHVAMCSAVVTDQPIMPCNAVLAGH